MVGELAGGHPGLFDALLDHCALAREGDFSGRGLVPSSCDAETNGAVDLFLGEAHRVVVAAMRGAGSGAPVTLRAKAFTT